MIKGFSALRIASNVAKKNMSTKSLKEILKEQIPIKQEALKKLKAEYGHRSLGEVTVDQKKSMYYEVEGESSMEDAGSRQQNPKIINRHKSFPHTLFRLLNSRTPSMKARPKTDGPGSFDMVIKSGMVHPLETDEFLGPNGASFRPNTFEEYYLVSGRSTKSFICEVPAGTEVPPGCVLVHEFGDHFSLQPAEVMTVEQFNNIVTQFLQGFRVYKRDEWLRAHPLGSQLVLK